MLWHKPGSISKICQKISNFCSTYCISSSGKSFSFTIKQLERDSRSEGDFTAFKFIAIFTQSLSFLEYFFRHFGTCHYVMFSEIRGAATFVWSNVQVEIAKFMLKLRNHLQFARYGENWTFLKKFALN